MHVFDLHHYNFMFHDAVERVYRFISRSGVHVDEAGILTNERFSELG